MKKKMFFSVLQNDTFFIGGLLRIGYKIENVSVNMRIHHCE